MKRCLIAAFAMALVSTPASAELIRSDLPLWGHGDAPETTWPQHFTSADGGFGCASKLRFGDWRLVTRGPDDAREFVEWMRIHNYGVFHCAAGFRRANGRAGLPDATPAFGYLVDLGPAPSGRETLHALQIGMAGGSEYVLLAAESVGADDGPRAYRVLAADCPAGARRKGRRIDIFSTSYCAPKDRRMVIAMARRAAAKPSVTRLEYAGDFEPPDPG